MTTKSDLVDRVANTTGLAKADAAKAVDATFDAIVEALAGGERVTVLGFGNFTVKDRAARVGRNPSNGEPVNIPASKAVKFKQGKGLGERL